MFPPLKEVISYKLLVISFSFFLFLSHQSSGITDNFCYAQKQTFMRVAIIQDAESLNLKINGAYEIRDAQDGLLVQGRNLKSTAAVYAKGILLAGRSFSADRILLEAKEEEAILVNGRRFRGIIQLIKKDNAHLAVVNYIDLEDYIKGVLYHEVSHYWPLQVLKAQAVACRTYALYQIEKNKARDYDATSDIYSQVYGGRTSERYRTNQAVRETKGKVLTYQGKIFPAYYHATCAGYTEDAVLLWDIDLAPLKGVPCDFCKDSPHFAWHYVLAQDELVQKLSTAGYKIGKPREIVVADRDKSNRVTKLKFSDDKKTIEISAKDFRNIIGPNIIRSTNFTVDLANDDVVFVGSGWGHGVGLCQWGAYFMAKLGYSDEQILRYYYPQADVKTF